MDKLLEILEKHKDKVSYQISFTDPQVLTIQFKDGTILTLCEHTKQNPKK